MDSGKLELAVDVQGLGPEGSSLGALVLES